MPAHHEGGLRELLLIVEQGQPTRVLTGVHGDAQENVGLPRDRWLGLPGGGALTGALPRLENSRGGPEIFTGFDFGRAVLEWTEN